MRAREVGKRREQISFAWSHSCPDKQLDPDESEKDSDKNAEGCLRESVQEFPCSVGADEGDGNAEDECQKDAVR